VTDAGDDVSTSVTKLSQALASYGTPARIHLRLLDNEDTQRVDHWDVEAGSPSATARPGKPASADVVLVLRQDTWLQIAQGHLSPFDALFGGRLRVGGDLELAKQITRHLSDRSVPFVSPC
jgi:hypothetical protein